jgi:hypothetical protein
MIPNFFDLEREALVATGESASIDFKGHFDPAEKSDWCELIKDIVAIANSGGGSILFGLDDDGQPTGLDCTEILRCDPADITNKLLSYTGKHFADFKLVAVQREGLRFGCLLIQAAPVPLVFVSPGTYAVADNKQKSAFSVGAVYFRHGAKSQPGTSDDLETFLKREIAAVREVWIGRLRQVVEAPLDAAIHVIPSEGVRRDDESGTAIRLTNDPTAPAYRLADPNLTHPFRQKEVIAQVSSAIGASLKVSSHDILCVRRVHVVDDSPVYCYRGNFASPTYSQAFVDWLLAQYQADTLFFEKCKADYRRQRQPAE